MRVPMLQAQSIWNVASSYAAMWLKWPIVLWMSTAQFELQVVVVVTTTALLLPEIPKLTVLPFPCKVMPETRVVPKITVCVRKREF